MANFSGKFNRRYLLKLEVPDNKNLEIQYPATLQFEVIRNNLASANTAKFTIYNLGQNIRNMIYKDVFDTSTFRAIQLHAGYDDGINTFMPRIFNGYIKVASSHRERENYITEIECYDSYLPANSNVSIPFAAGTSKTDIIKGLMNGMPDLQGQVIGNGFEGKSIRGSSFMGDPMESLKQITDNQIYIDDQKAYVLGPNDVIPSEIRILTSENGLLNTPRKCQQFIEVDCLFEPRLKPSQLLELQSTTEPRFNGVYKVTGITHRGIISGAVNGECKTTIQMLIIKDVVVVYDQSTNEYIARSKNGQ